MDAEAWKILIGAVAVIASGLGGQWLAGHNTRLHAEANHERDKQKWATDLRYQTYLSLIEQFETSFRRLTRASKGDPKELPQAWNSINGLKATALRIVGSPEVRNLANEVDASFRNWHSDLAAGRITQESAEPRRDENLRLFQSLIDRIRLELGMAS
ncbi:hypothetical protein [Paenarthrobacter sp. 22069]|uniref:hypothetical protein n=1 Tax=Paenarthrobacter sp. 22069 TaxID=3453864 RepID=UPI003F85C678